MINFYTFNFIKILTRKTSSDPFFSSKRGSIAKNLQACLPYLFTSFSRENYVKLPRSCFQTKHGNLTVKTQSPDL